MQSLLRANLLTAQVASGGPEAGQPVGSAGEAITHFRDDVEDVTMFIDGFVDISAGVVFTVLAGLVLGSVDGRAALVLLIPLIGVAMATRTLDGRIKRYRAADRIAASAVSGLLGDVMAAATTVKVNNAIEPTIAHLRKLVDRAAAHGGPRPRARRERVGVQPRRRRRRARPGAADRAGAMASGTFSVGELAVFSAYLGWLSFLPRMVGRMLARRKQVAVAFDRMSVLVADTDVGNTVTDRHLPIGLRDQRNRPDTARPSRVPLDALDVRHLTALYPTGAGVHDVSFTVRSRQLHRADRADRIGQEHAAAGHAGSGPPSRRHRRRLVERRAARRPRRVPDPAQRGVPAAGAAADLRLGRRQRRARHRRRRPTDAGAAAGSGARRHRRDARRRDER